MEAFDSTWISSRGEFLDRFEAAIASRIEIPYVSAVCNGTAALHLALHCLDLRPGDEVIVPDLTFVATANAVAYTGATPVLADIDADTLCLDPASVRSLVSARRSCG